MNDKVNELKGKASELSSKLVSAENKAKAKSFANSLVIGFLKGLKWFITALYEKVLPSVDNALQRRCEQTQQIADTQKDEQ